MSSPTADTSVRVAWADDARGIAGVQVAAWHEAYADLLPPDVLATMAVEDVAAAWHASLTRPKDARNRVLVALERGPAAGRGTASTCSCLRRTTGDRPPRSPPDAPRRGWR